MVIQGVFLWALGPYLASWITPNIQEQASIWCFMSIAQIGIMLFIIRDALVLNWGRDPKNVEAAKAHANGHSNGHSNGSGATSDTPKKTPKKATTPRGTADKKSK